MDMMNQQPMTVKEVIIQNNEILRSISLTPDQREEYGKLCSVIDNNNACIEAMNRQEMEPAEAEPAQEVEEDAVPATE